LRRILLLAGAAVSPASALCAQTTPAPVPAPAPTPAPAPAPVDAAAPPPAEENIVVRAQSDQRTAIDRDTYIVRDTAEARTSNALDLLGRIPAITVQPDNSIRLLGTTGVTVLVDGRPSPNPNVLRDLQGSEIARIEVVSNPSAQFSASGTGGVINIITRRTAPDGLRGSVTASVSRYGGHELRAGPTWTSGKWTVSGNAGWTVNGSEAESVRERLSLDPASTAPDTFETAELSSRFEFINGNGQVSYRLTDKKTITLQGGLITANARTISDSQIVRSNNPGAPLAQLTASDFGYDAYSASLEYRAEGSRQGELLTTSIQQQRFAPVSEVSTTVGEREFRFRSGAFTLARTFKLDYVRPLAGGRRVLVGGSVSQFRDFDRLEQSGDLPFGGNPFPASSTLDGSTREAAVYGSYQFPLLGGTLLAGLRVEGRDYQFADPGLGEGPGDVHFFPSFHLERRLAEWLTGNLSYSRRITWPRQQQLSPVLRFSDSTTATGGNPALRPELTDAFEARLRGEVAGQTVSLTLFNRRTDDLFSSLSTLTDDGLLVTQPVNVGTRNDLGASVAVQGSFLRGLSYTLNANLIDRLIETEFGPVREQKSTTYSGTAQLDYRDGQDGRRGADRISITATYSGPYDDGLLSRAAFFRASATWSHSITDRLSSVVTVDDVFGPTEFRTTTFSETALTRTTNFSDGPRFKVGLTYSLGRPGQPQPPTPAGPSIPIPGAQ
jgi:outer membrane receptor protein involved in Fe transport